MTDRRKQPRLLTIGLFGDARPSIEFDLRFFGTPALEEEIALMGLR